jgi:hypothetical protein
LGDLGIWQDNVKIYLKQDVDWYRIHWRIFWTF